MTLSGEGPRTTALREDSGPDSKSFEIPKRLIWEAWKRVAANQGGPGVDQESIEVFRNRLARNLYALWNRMSSGSYFIFPSPRRYTLRMSDDDNDIEPIQHNDRYQHLAGSPCAERHLYPLGPFSGHIATVDPGATRHRASGS